ncbi:MAG: EAL domain-containing protein [Acidimicrobiia bacterium]
MFSGPDRHASRFWGVFDYAPFGQVFSDADGCITTVNDQLASMLDYEASELLGRPLVSLVDHDDQGSIAQGTELLREGKVEKNVAIRRFIKRNGTLVSTRVVTFVVREQDELCGWVSVVSPLSGYDNSLAQHFAEAARKDPLTGLSSRARLLAELSTLGDACYAVMFLDLDGLGAINDYHGHLVGDEILIEVAKRLCNVSMEGDIVARVGGDEFAIICLNPHVCSTPESHLIERIQTTLRLPVETSDGGVYISASIGISDGSIPAKSGLERLQQADAAAYQCKRDGKSQVMVYNAQLRAANDRNWETETLLRNAIENSSLVLHYQPIVSLVDNSIIGVETLTRLRNDDGSLVPPDTFIPLAERSGLIVPMGEKVLREASQYVAQLRSLTNRPLGLSVNISARQADQTNLIDVVLEALENSHLPPEALTLELTESTLLDAGPAATARFVALREAGVQIALDDFGTGYSSLTYLQRLPITRLKIDQSFVAKITYDSNSAAIIRAVTSLAADLGLLWVAEGIETEEQASILRALGTGFGQGFLFSPPLPSTEFSKLFSAT